MTGTGRDILKGRLRLLTATLALAVMAAVIALVAAPASAHVGVTHSLASHKGIKASVTYKSFDTPGNTSAYIYIDNRYGWYTTGAYVQARPIFDEWWLNDGYWKRATNDVAYGRAYGQNWYDTTISDYDAYQFRICRNIPNYPDSCGTATTLYG